MRKIYAWDAVTTCTLKQQQQQQQQQQQKNYIPCSNIVSIPYSMFRARRMAKSSLGTTL